MVAAHLPRTLIYTLRSREFLKSFGIGVLLILFIYCVFYVCAVTLNKEYFKDIESQLATITIPIETENPAIIEGSILEAPNDLKSNTQTQQNASSPLDILEEETDNTHLSTGQSNKTLPEAPVPGFYEVDNGMKLPIIRKSDRVTPFELYKRTMPLHKGKESGEFMAPAVSVLISNVGLSTQITKQLIDIFPPEVTFAISPYADEAEKTALEARRAGHEIWLHLPIEDDDFPNSDSGSLALLSHKPLEDNQIRLRIAMGQFSGYAGIAADISRQFNSSAPLLIGLSREIFERGLGFFDLDTNAGDIISHTAQRQQGHYAKATINLSDPQLLKSPNMGFDLLKNTLEEEKQAIIVIPPYPALLETLKDLLLSLDQAGIDLVPLSALTPVNHNEPSSPSAP